MNCFTWIQKKKGGGGGGGCWEQDPNTMAMGMDILGKAALEKMAYCFCK